MDLTIMTFTRTTIPFTLSKAYLYAFLLNSVLMIIFLNEVIPEWPYLTRVKNVCLFLLRVPFILEAAKLGVCVSLS
jgi:hypothetical protein